MSFFPEALVTQSNDGGLGMNVYVNAPPSGAAPIPVKVEGGLTITSATLETRATQSVEVLNWPAVQPVTGTVYVANQPTGSSVVSISGTSSITGTVSVDNFPIPVTAVTATVTNFPAPVTAVTATVTNFPVPVTQVTASITNFPPNQQVSQGASGSVPWKITGSVAIGNVVTVTGTVHLDNPPSGSVNGGTVDQGASGSQAWKVDPIPSAPLPTKYIPVRLTDGTEFYVAGGSSGSIASAVVGLDYPSSPGTFQNIDRVRIKKRFDMGSPMYIGFAPLGTPDTSAGWTIKKITLDSEGNPELAEWTAHGMATWINRALEEYL